MQDAFGDIYGIHTRRTVLQQRLQGRFALVQKAHEEQSSSKTMIIPTLEAFSQLYLDYLTKQKSEGEVQEGSNDAESSKEGLNE